MTALGISHANIGIGDHETCLTFYRDIVSLHVAHNDGQLGRARCRDA